MKVASSALTAALGTASLLPLSAVALRGGSNAGAKNIVYESTDGSGRSLQTLTGTFSPLGCNSALDSATCTPWNSLFGTSEAGVVEIACGECVSMGGFTAGETVSVGGLNVLGRLDFPEGTKVNLETPHIFVQGKLSMLSTSPISGEPDVKITMTGDSDQVLVPHTDNSAVCPQGGCNVGPKAIVVAGGQLDIDALGDTCPTWSYVQNFANTGVPQAPDGTFPVAPTPPEGCTLDLVNTTFDDPTLGNMGLDGWTGNVGANERLLEGSHDGTKYMHIDSRTDSNQGPLLSLRRAARSCLRSEVEYFISAKVKLSASSAYPSHVSSCSTDGSNCPKLKYSAMASDDKVRWSELSAMTKAAPADGTWFDFVGSFKLREIMVNETNIFEIFTIVGPEKQVDIAVDDIRIGLASAAMYPDPNNVCTNLIINGGGNDLPGMTFPFFSWRKSAGMNKLELREESGNSFFRVPDRNDANAQEIDTIAYELPIGCLVPGATYSFSSKIRINADSEGQPMVQIRTVNNDGSIKHDRFINSCPKSSNSIGWTTCTGELTWQAYHSDSGNAQRADLIITLQDALGADVDFDDVALDFKSGAPTGGLTLDAAVTDSCYAPGAKAVIPSDEIRWEPTQEVTVQTIDGAGGVAVNETYGLDIPLTSSEDANFAGQFMFLSRNVEFSGDGGTITVLATDAVQKLQGVSIKGFGQAGILGRNPINFRMVSDATGSVVKKNSITGSSNRCVQVQATNNLYVGENVAYNNQGHCYALQEGSETGNVFEKNIGASIRLATADIAGDIDNIDNKEVAVFFTPAPGNSWKDNVAAGSEMMGYYFRQRLNVVGETAASNQYTFPFQTPLVEFSGNVAHSNAFNGVEIMGYNPLSPQTFLNTRSYKNRGQGINIKASSQVIIDGGVVADSRNGMDVFKSDSVQIKNAQVIGYSMLYKTHADNTDGAKRLCTPGGSESVVGIRFHPNKKKELPGVTVDSVSFSRFGIGSGCDGTPHTAALGFIYHGISTASFDSSVTVSNLSFDEGSRPQDEIKLCSASSIAGVNDIIIGDTTGSLNPSGTEAGTIVSAALSCSGTAIDMPDSCAKYCSGDSAPAPAPSPTESQATYPSATPDPASIPADVAASACFSNGGFENAGLSPWMALPGPQVSSQLTTGFGGSGQSVVVYDRQNQARGGLYQMIQQGCLVADAWYEVSADVRLMQGGTQTPFVCKPGVMWYTNPYSCGFMTLLFGNSEPKIRQEVSAITGPYNDQGEAWNKYYGAFKATADVMSQAPTIMLMVAGAPVGVDMYVDNVVFKQVDDISTSLGAIDCSSPVVNGDFETGDLIGWMIRGNGGDTDIGVLSVVAGADGSTSAARHSGRPAGESRFNGILQKVPSYCFTEGSQWEITAKFRYFESDGTPIACLKNSTTDVDACPTFELEAAGVRRSGPLPNTDTSPMVVGGWNALSSTFTVPANMAYSALEGIKDSNPFWRDMWFKVSSVLQQREYELDDIVMTRIASP